MGDPSQTPFYLTCTALLLFVASRSLYSTLRRHIFIPRSTILADIPNLSKPRKGGKLTGKVIICGGSVAGLLAAAVCADNFDDVIIIEPEEWVSTDKGTNLPERPATRLTSEGYRTLVNRRKRVVQTTSLNFIQPISLKALRALFPAVDEEARAIGGQPNLSDLQLYIDGKPLKAPQTRPGYQGEKVETLYLSRDAYETLLRRLVSKYRPNVTFLVGTATGLEYSVDNPGLIVGVHVKTQDDLQHLENADFVVDATGPAQAGYKWFKSTLPPALRMQYNPSMCYMTATYHIPPHLRSKLPTPSSKSVDTPQWLYTLFPDTTVETKTFLIAINENSKLVMACGGWMTVERPRSPAEIQEFLASIRTSHPVPVWIYELLDFLQKHCADLNDSYCDAKTQSCSYIQYHKAPMDSIPCNYVAVGDSIMKLNPVFAQGLGMTCIGAVTLDAQLRKLSGLEPRLLKGFSAKYFAALAARTSGAWEETKTTDYGVNTTIPAEGESLEMGEGERLFLKYVLSVALEDPIIESAVWHVDMFLAPATDLFTLRLFLKVGWKWISSKLHILK